MAISDRIQHLARNVPFKLMNFIGGLTIMLLSLAVWDSSARVRRLEKKSIEHEAHLSKRAFRKNYTIIETSTAAGAIYIRWGRSVCQRPSMRVYEGVAAGQYYTHTGGASNVLCLPKDPLWGNFTSAAETSAYIYGAEYELSNYKALGKNGVFSTKNAQSLHDHNMPCAVCETKNPSSVIMLPARDQCYAGWNPEYTGYLMAGHYAHKGRGTYICVDKDAEADPAGYRDENGALFYPVQSSCGSLICPPYVQNKELTCAVCTKAARSKPIRSYLS